MLKIYDIFNSVVDGIRKGENKMSHRETLGKRNSTLIKVGIFLSILLFAGISFIESQSILDAIYFIIVLLIFARFLWIKLYRQ